MIKKRRFSRVFFGWWTVITGGIICLWGHGYQAYGFSALFKPISSELGFSRAVTSVAASIGRFEGGVEAPAAGWLTDRFGPRWIILLGVFLISIGLILMYFIQSLWAFYLVWGIIVGIGINTALAVPLDTAITNWFVKKRGLAISIKWLFSGLSGVLVLPLIAWLISTQGWRTTCLIGGVVMALVGLPLCWFFIKQRRPEYYGLLPDGAVAKEAPATNQMIEKGVEYAAEVHETEFTLRQAMKTPAYWLLIATNAVHSLAAPSINIHGVPFLTDIGINPVMAASMLAIMVFASLPSRFVGGILADRVRTSQIRYLIGGAYLLQAAGFAVFLLNRTVPMIYVWFILYGIGNGANLTLFVALRARYFGRKAFGSIEGTSSMFMTPVGVIAPVYVGWIYDSTGSYISAFTLVAILIAATAVFMPLVLPPKPPARVTDIHQVI